MNIFEQEDLIKGLPDQALMREAQQPSGQLPQYLVVSEIQRRQDMRKRFSAENQETPQGTVKDQILSGIAAMGDQQPQQQQPPQPGGMPPQPGGMPPGGMPPQPGGMPPMGMPPQMPAPQQPMPQGVPPMGMNDGGMTSYPEELLAFNEQVQPIRDRLSELPVSPRSGLRNYEDVEPLYDEIAGVRSQYPSLGLDVPSGAKASELLEMFGPQELQPAFDRMTDKGFVGDRLAGMLGLEYDRPDSQPYDSGVSSATVAELNARMDAAIDSMDRNELINANVPDDLMRQYDAVKAMDRDSGSKMREALVERYRPKGDELAMNVVPMSSGGVTSPEQAAELERQYRALSAQYPGTDFSSIVKRLDEYYEAAGTPRAWSSRPPSFNFTPGATQKRIDLHNALQDKYLVPPDTSRFSAEEKSESPSIPPLAAARMESARALKSALDRSWDNSLTGGFINRASNTLFGGLIGGSSATDADTKKVDPKSLDKLTVEAAANTTGAAVQTQRDLAKSSTTSPFADLAKQVSELPTGVTAPDYSRAQETLNELKNFGSSPVFNRADFGSVIDQIDRPEGLTDFTDFKSDYSELITEAERRAQKIRDDARKDAGAQALIQLGAGIAEGDIAGALRGAGATASEIMGQARKEARAEDQLSRQMKIAQMESDRDIGLMGKQAGIAEYNRNVDVALQNYAADRAAELSRLGLEGDVLRETVGLETKIADAAYSASAAERKAKLDNITQQAVILRYKSLGEIAQLNYDKAQLDLIKPAIQQALGDWMFENEEASPEEIRERLEMLTRTFMPDEGSTALTQGGASVPAPRANPNDPLNLGI